MTTVLDRRGRQFHRTLHDLPNIVVSFLPITVVYTQTEDAKDHEDVFQVKQGVLWDNGCRNFLIHFLITPKFII